MLSRQFLVYVGVGVLSALIDVGSMYALLALTWSTTTAVTLAYAAGTGFNYLCHQRITFRAAHNTGTMLRFLTVLILNYLLTLACVWLGVHAIDSALAGKIASLPLVTLNGFFLGKYWIFRPR